MVRKVKAWHFLNSTGQLSFGDGREPKIGERLSVSASRQGEIAICRRGLHGSIKLKDAVKFALELDRTGYLCLVELDGWMDWDSVHDISNDISNSTKIAAQYRTALSKVDMSDIFSAFRDLLAVKFKKMTGTTPRSEYSIFILFAALSQQSAR